MAPHAVKKRKISHSSGVESPGALEASTAESSVSEAGLASMESRSTSIHARPSTDTAIAYNTTIFQMQMEELISEVQPEYEKRMHRLEKVLRRLKEVIEKIPSQAPSSVTEAERRFCTQHNLYIPFPTPRLPVDAKYTVAFEKPTNINIVGSYVRKTMVKSDSSVMIDMAITMPMAIFQEKDYLNYRYFYKRAYYLACIAAGIEESKICNLIAHYSYQNDCCLQPVLLLTPINDGSENDFSSTKIIMRIILGTVSNAFPKHKTLPWSNCLRATIYEDDGSLWEKSSTPIYNATLRAECSIDSYLKLLHDTSIVVNGFQNACILGATWLRQRGLGTGIRQGGFGAFELAAMISLLLQTGPKEKPILSVGYSSYQLFKALLQFLVSRDLAHEPLLLFVDHTKYSGLPRSDTPLLFDGKRSMNLLYKMSSWSYNELRREASVSLKTLNDSPFNRFQPSFISRVNNSVLQFDNLLHIVMPRSWEASSKDVRAIDSTHDFCTKLYRILHRGLGDRVVSIHLKTPQFSPWATAEFNLHETYEPMILVGFILDASQANRVVDHGPPVEDKKAAASFRKFWGEKAELRRFKDGRILESLIWAEKPPMRSVWEEIVMYVIHRHMGQEVAKSIGFPAKIFDQMLSVPREPSSSLAQYEPLQRTYEDLEKQIRGIDGLPLQIRQISAACAELRYTSILPHIPNMRNSSNLPMDVIVQFEASARWPDDIQAIQRTKIAFLLKMGELLEASISDLTTRLGLEHESQKLHNLAFLDVVCPNKLSFRLRIHHDREIALLDRQLKDKMADRRSREQAAIAISAYKQTFIQAPSHTQALRTLCTLFPLLSPSIRLMKHWCNSHFLSPHIRDELIELLVVRTFIVPYPWQPPASIRTCFLRTLFFIAKWDWRSEPLIVDFDSSMTPDDITAINTRFEAWRKLDPIMNRTVMFAASNLDPNGVTWTEQGPAKVVAARFTSLAKAANSLLREQGLEVDPMALFAHSLSDYDFVIRLDDTLCGGKQGREKKISSFKNLQSSCQEGSLVGYDAVQLFIKDVQRVHGDSIVLFYNSVETSIVAGLWRPHTGPRTWKVNLAYSTAPVQDGRTAEGGYGSRVTINKTAILNDIVRLGGDMVAGIDDQE